VVEWTKIVEMIKQWSKWKKTYMNFIFHNIQPLIL
jgi:hypothetical protein